MQSEIGERNTRRNRWIKLNGQRKTLIEWSQFGRAVVRWVKGLPEAVEAAKKEVAL